MGGGKASHPAAPSLAGAAAVPPHRRGTPTGPSGSGTLAVAPRGSGHIQGRGRGAGAQSPPPPYSPGKVSTGGSPPPPPRRPTASLLLPLTAGRKRGGSRVPPLHSVSPAPRQWHRGRGVAADRYDGRGGSGEEGAAAEGAGPGPPTGSPQWNSREARRGVGGGKAAVTEAVRARRRAGARRGHRPDGHGHGRNTVRPPPPPPNRAYNLHARVRTRVARGVTVSDGRGGRRAGRRAGREAARALKVWRRRRDADRRPHHHHKAHAGARATRRYAPTTTPTVVGGDPPLLPPPPPPLAR